MCPGGRAEGVAVCMVDGSLLGAEGEGGNEDARGDVVEGGEAEGVQGAELEYGLAVATGLARPVEGRAGLVEDAEEGELGEDRDTDDLRGAVVVVPVCCGTSAVTRVGRPWRESMRENSCLSGCMMRPARREHSRRSVAMAATSLREGVMKRRSSLYERWVARRDAEWPGMVRGRVMEVLRRMALVMTRLGAW